MLFNRQNGKQIREFIISLTWFFGSKVLYYIAVCFSNYIQYAHIFMCVHTGQTNICFLWRQKRIQFLIVLQKYYTNILYAAY